MRKCIFIIFICIVSTCVEAQQIITRFAGNLSSGYSGDGGNAILAQLGAPYGMAADAAGNVYIADYTNNVVRKVNTAGIISTFAGTGVGGYTGDGGQATLAQLKSPSALAIDATGNLYIADRDNNCIRKVSTTGIINTVVGNNTYGHLGDGGPATNAQLAYPMGIAFDKYGNLYITDNGNYQVRKVSAAGIISRFAGNYIPGYTGDNGPATAASVNNPCGIATDTSGNVYVADGYNNAIRKINTLGIITTVAGNGAGAYTGDGGPATAAAIWIPLGVTIDVSGNMYIAEYQNNIIRKVNTSGTISTFAGIGYGYYGDGGLATAAGLHLPRAVYADNAGNLFIADYANAIVREIHLNRAPAFTGGASQSLSVCQSTAANPINSLLAINDLDVAQAETWSVKVAPVHGSLGGFPRTIAAVSGTTTPTGLTYSPAPGYVGTDTFTIRVADGFDTAVTGISVTVNALAFAGTLTGGSAVCAGSSITLADATPGGIWSAGNANATVSAGTVTGVTAGTVNISYTVSNGCGPISAIKTITINALPNAGTIPSGSSVCPGSSITLSSGAAGGAWSAANANASINASSGLLTGVTAGTDIITYTVTNSCGTATTTTNVTINLPPVAGSITGTNTVCQGATTSLADATPGGVWSSSNDAIATVAGGIVSGVAGGTCTISYSVSNSCGTASAIKIVSVNPSAVAGTLSGPSAVCAGSAITLSATATGGTWGSSNANATVSTTGIVTGATAGVAVISYNVTNACGTVSSVKTITIESLPVAGTITGSSTVCVGSSVSLANSATGGVWSSGTANATASATGIVSGISAGNTVISYTVTNSCGTAVATHAVTVNALAVAGTLSGSGTLCMGASVTLTPSVSGGTWSSTSANAPVNSAGIVSGVTAGTATISYTSTNTCGAVAATKIVTVEALIVLAPITGLSSVCAGSTIVLSNTLTGGSWVSGSTGVATVSGGTVSGISAGVVAISYSSSNSCGIASVTHPVTVNPLPSAGSLSGPSSVCNGSTITLTTTGTGGAWSSSSNATVSGGTVTGIAAGTAGISYTVINSCGTAAATKTVTIDVSPFAGSITGAGTVCQGLSVALAATGSGGTWASGDATATVSTTGAVTGITAGTATISYTVVNSCGTAMATKIITVNPSPVAGLLSGTLSVCSGAATTITPTVGGGVWSVVGSAASVAGGVVTGISAGTVTISYAVSNSCGIVAATTVVTVNAAPAAAVIAGPATVCAGATVSLTNSISGGAWASSDVAASIATATPTTGTLSGIAAGTSVISYTIINSCGTSHAAYTITVNPIPVVNTPVNQLVCSGAATTAVSFSGTISGAAYGWTNTNPAIGLVATGSGNIASFTAINTGTTVLVPTITVTPTANGCSGAPATFTITVNPAPTVIVPTDASVCNGALSPALNFSGPLSGTTYSWTNSDVSIGLAATGTGNIASFTATNSGTVVVVATINVTPSANSCTGMAQSFAINIKPTPSITIPANQTFCKGSVTATISFTGPVSGTTYSWTNDNTATGLAATGTGDIASFTAANSGLAAITAIITVSPAANGCTGSTGSFSIVVNPAPAPPVINTMPAATLCSNAQFMNFGTDAAAPAGTYYTWSVTNGILDKLGPDHRYCLVSFPELGNAAVTLTATNLADNCTSHAIYNISVANNIAAVPEVIYYNKQFICMLYTTSDYVWGYDDAAILDPVIIFGEHNQNYYNETPDTLHRYYWVITNDNGCVQKAYCNKPATGVYAPTLQSEALNLYPNPADNILHIALTGAMHIGTTIQVYEPAGRQVATATLIDNKGAIDISRFAAGLYIIRCNSNGVSIASIFIKR